MRRVLIALVLTWAIAASPVQAARLALVIGINHYDLVPPLQKAIGDATAMSSKLNELGFAVTTVIDPDRRQFNQAIETFRESLHAGDVAFVHFSGHGIEVDGRNLLLPRDIPLPISGDESYLATEAIDLSSLMDRIAESGAAVRIFVIDACRTNPFAQSDIRGLEGPGGLGPAAPSRGSFVLYSAGTSQVALDRLGPDDQNPTSVYTRVLLDKLDLKGASISEVARDVRTEVAALASTIGYDQSPAYYDGLTEDYVLTPSAAANAPEASGSVEAEAFDRARELGTAHALQAFLANYPNGVFADLARAALSDLPPSPVLSAKDTPDAVEAFSVKQRLQQLWDEAHQFENAGDNASYLQRASEARLLAAASFGTDSEAYADASNQMVGAFSSVGQVADAMAASRDAIRIYTVLFGDHDLRVLNEKANLAARLAATGKVDEATKMFDDLLTAYDTMPLHGDGEAQYAAALESYAQLAMRKGDGPAAERYASRAVAILEAAGLTDQIEYGWVASTEARILRADGKCEAAQAMFVRAASGMKAAQVAETQHDYADILADIKKGCPSL
jgi:hypothetical protein